MAAANDYCLPADSTPAALRRKWRLLAQLFSRQDQRDTLAQPEATLSSLPPAQLDRLAPPLRWEGAARAFDQIYAAKAGNAPAPGVVGILVGQPFCGHADILAHWARGRSVRLLEPPTAQEILAADVQWLTRCCDSGPGLWALPALERCYLRNANGLALVRGFLDLAFSGALGPGVIGCDSWAWAYLQRICAWPATPVLTLQAFDGAALTTLLLQPETQPTQAVRFLSAHSGISLLPEPEDGEEDAQTPVSPELRQLAARCRGNLGVAWHFWRERLRTAIEPQATQTGDDAPPTDRRHLGGPGTRTPRSRLGCGRRNSPGAACPATAQRPGGAAPGHLAAHRCGAFESPTVAPARPGPGRAAGRRSLASHPLGLPRRAGLSTCTRLPDRQFLKSNAWNPLFPTCSRRWMRPR
ncbi:MAG: hypothetical protein Q8O81_13605 [Giesbergeria sp.]|nr:hypothetical protein [Giesbergeria sp.]